jgi:nicotinamide mononucleotide adenylyltransferase
MCNLAAEQTSSWLMVDSWEAFQTYQRTAVVLDHFDYEINTVLGGVQTEDGEHRDVRVMLLAGSDLISTMSEPGVWSYADVSVPSIRFSKSQANMTRRSLHSSNIFLADTGLS